MPSPFRRSHLLLCLLALSASVLPRLASAQGTPVAPPATAPAAGIVEAGATPSAKPAHEVKAHRSPMAAELDSLFAARTSAMAAQRQRIAMANAENGERLQRELIQMKLDLELESLRVQARWARRENRIADAVELEAVVEQILHPRIEARPVPRPAADPNAAH
jgi:hypothetical protein